MANLEHNHVLHFPNGRGHTPCTKEYLLTKNERDAICDLNNGQHLADLDADDYQAWSLLDDKLAQMQLDGHLGKSVIY